MPGAESTMYELRQNRIPNDFVTAEFDINGIPKQDVQAHSLQACMFGIMIGGIIFGSIHVAGWNLIFPTPIEQKLWRISSVLLTVLLPIAFFPWFLAAYSTNVYNMLNDLAKFFQIYDLIFGGLYIAARLFMFVEIFRTLLYLPPDTYISTWASNVPHVA
jgi:hypothetical protein